MTEKQTHYHARTMLPTDRLPLLVRPHILNGDHIPHDHDFWEAVLVLGGKGNHVCAQGNQAVHAGDAFLLRPGIWHTYADCENLEVYNCCFGLPVLKQELAAFFREPVIHQSLLAGDPVAPNRGITTFLLSVGQQAQCRDLLEAMRQRGEETSAFADRERMAYLMLFLCQLGRIAASDARSLNVDVVREPLHPAADQMIHLLEERLDEPWSIQDLSEAVHLEGAYCIRLFKKATGLSPIAYLCRCRLERAATLLLRTNLPISEIASQIGWLDQNYFARRFRTHFGISATEYRTRFSRKAYPSLEPDAAKISDAPRERRSS